MNEKKPKKTEIGGILFALFIVFTGVFSLMFNVSPLTGFLRFLQYWPLFFVGLGLWLIFKNLNYEKVGAAVLAVMLVATMYSAFSQVLPTLEVVEEKAVPPGATDMDVSLDLLLGKYSVGSCQNSLYILKGHPSMYVRMQTEGGTVRLSFSLNERAFLPLEKSSSEYEILLNDSLPLSITSNVGPSSCSFDFSHLNVEKFTLNGGVSSTDITFGETNTKAEITGGISSVTIYVPQSVGVKVTYEGLITFSVPPGWTRTDHQYKSPNYDTAAYKIDITCTMGMSSFTIAYVGAS